MKQFLLNTADLVRRLGSLLPVDLLALVSRFAVATVFWRSAQTKFSGWSFLDQSWQFYNLNDSTLILFEYEYALPLLPSEVAAYMATTAEFFLSIALVIGVFTRLSALGLLCMTGVIQVFVYPEAWSTHIVWSVGMLYLVKYGAGRVSADYVLTRQVR